MRSVTRCGHAKINLHLDITGIMENGFHSVNNVMQSISLADRITVRERADTDILVSCDNPSVPTGEDNLAVRAARLLLEAAGTSVGADIYIEKRIPMAAGLAGGSADAAAVLLGMNELLGEPLSVKQLCGIGSKIGSDVPFCIVQGSAFADGKGDILHPFPSMPHCTIVVACGGEGVSTPMAYRLLDEKYNRFSSYSPISTEPLRRSAEQKDLDGVAANTFNVFEEPILAIRPVAASIKEILQSSGALRAMMSGSGPSVFGIFGNEDIAKEAAKRIEEIGVTPHICHPIIQPL